MATDERLRRRYDELRTAGAPISGSLEELLGQAPLECLRAAILVDGPIRQPPLSFRGSPLGVITYVDPSGAPVLLCIIANHAPDAPIRSEGRATIFAIVLSYLVGREVVGIGDGGAGM